MVVKGVLYEFVIFVPLFLCNCMDSLAAGIRFPSFPRMNGVLAGNKYLKKKKRALRSGADFCGGAGESVRVRVRPLSKSLRALFCGRDSGSCCDGIPFELGLFRLKP